MVFIIAPFYTAYTTVIIFLFSIFPSNCWKSSALNCNINKRLPRILRTVESTWFVSFRIADLFLYPVWTPLVCGFVLSNTTSCTPIWNEKWSHRDVIRNYACHSPLEPAVSLPCSQELATSPYPEPLQTSPWFHSIYGRCILILCSRLQLGLSSGLFPLGSPTKVMQYLRFQVGNEAAKTLLWV